MKPLDAGNRLDVDPFRLAGRAARARNRRGTAPVPAPLVGGSVRHRVRRLDGHARRARVTAAFFRAS